VSEVRDAATVLVVRDRPDGFEVYLVRRHAKAAWLGDLFVFPGGAVDEADRSAAAGALVHGAARDLDAAFVFAAARETFEEAGLLFADRAIDAEALSAARRAMLEDAATFCDVLRGLGASIDASQLRYFSRWVTPPSEPRRFDARFFVARAPDDQIAEADALEVLDGRWLRPRDALDAFAREELGMIFPTITHLARIAAFSTVDELLDFASHKPIAVVEPDVTPSGLALPAGMAADAW
jgi:8-oxo-dGTP pyrophosphatase MutT (NUDIX family)